MACRHCGRTETSDEQAAVGVLEDVGDVICVDCRAEELDTRTTLTELEARVAAWEQLGDVTVEEIASRLDVDAGTVEECERRIRYRPKMPRKRQRSCGRRPNCSNGQRPNFAVCRDSAPIQGG